MPTYKYSGPKTKAHPKGDFRHGKAKLAKVAGGWRWWRECAEFIGGRWDGFVTYPRWKQVFKTKAEAMKVKPKW